MKPFLATRTRTFLIVLVAIAACGDNLIADPSFDLWCGETLCKPWKVTGKVTRVKTWHERDYGVSLGNGAVLSQRAKHDPVECIEFEVIADVSATADMWLEMDFRDDGTSEYEQLIPESRFTKLRYLVKAPTWYDSLRFILRKKGKGRAVLAQIRATPSNQCKGDALELVDRPNGADCDAAAQCASGVCGEAPALFAAGFDDLDDGKPRMTCGECSTKHACATGESCGAGLSEIGAYGACVPDGSLESGRWCLSSSECDSALCAAPADLVHETCAECTSDDDCANDEVCGVEARAGSVARVCHAQVQRALGELCVRDDECDSGACCNGSCSECCKGTHACKGGAACGNDAPEWLVAEASLCDPGSGERKKGQACVADVDCVSGACDEPEPICHPCVGDACQAVTSDECGFLRRLAGTCR